MPWEERSETIAGRRGTAEIVTAGPFLHEVETGVSQGLWVLDPLREEVPPFCQGGAVGVGNFDAVHRGHACVVRQLQELARRCHGPAVVLTFDPPPARLLRPETTLVPLTRLEDRAELLRKHGTDVVVVIRTSELLLQMEPEEFFQRVLLDGFRCRALVEGPTFTFGRGGRGNVDLLRKLCQQSSVELWIVPPLEHRGQILSSSRIRSELAAGRVREAAAMLGRPYHLAGRVGQGAGRGAALGFPTANLYQIDTLVPADGVYAGWAEVEGRRWPAAIHIGPPRTFGEQRQQVEAHLIGCQEPLRDRWARLYFLERLRDTRAFPSVEALVAQVRADIEAVAQLAVSWSCPPLEDSPGPDRKTQ
jgi:riboflavin kinase/FMN adenylyltransferase